MYRGGEQIDPRFFTTLEAMLKVHPLPVNKYRKNSGEGRSQVFGICKQRNNRYSGSRMNRDRPEIYNELLKIAHSILPPDFHWVSIQVNQNYQTAEHKDYGNRGESAIIGFGDYDGGDLMIEETPVNIKYRLVYFDGSLYRHSTASYTGNRFSLVFHTPDRDFKAIPTYQLFQDAKGWVLREDLGTLSRMYRKGKCIFSSDGVMPTVRSRRPTMLECVE
jgi:hypothetical protein